MATQPSGEGQAWVKLRQGNFLNGDKFPMRKANKSIGPRHSMQTVNRDLGRLRKWCRLLVCVLAGREIVRRL